MIFIFVVLCIVFAIALMVGRYSMSPSDFFKAIFTADEVFETQRSVIVNLRLPRTLMAALVGVMFMVAIIGLPTALIILMIY